MTFWILRNMSGILISLNGIKNRLLHEFCDLIFSLKIFSTHLYGHTLNAFYIWITFGFWKICLESWYLWLGSKISLCFFCMCFGIFFFTSPKIVSTHFIWTRFKCFLHINEHIYEVVLVTCVEESSRWNGIWNFFYKKKHKCFFFGFPSNISRFQTFFFKSKSIICRFR